MPPNAANKPVQFTSAQLRLIGLGVMLIEHTAAYFAAWLDPSLVTAAHLLGRSAIPIFCELLARGLRRTRNPRRYLLRLCITALITLFGSQLLMRLTGWGVLPQNILFSLTSAALCALTLERALAPGAPSLRLLAGISALAFFCTGLLLEGAYLVPLLTLTGYFARTPKTRIAAFVGVWLLTCLQALFLPDRHSALQPAMLLALPLIARTTDTARRPPATSQLIYALYPAHLWLLYLVRAFLAKPD